MAARVSPDGMDIEKVIILYFKAKKNNFKHYSEKNPANDNNCSV